MGRHKNEQLKKSHTDDSVSFKNVEHSLETKNDVEKKEEEKVSFGGSRLSESGVSSIKPSPEHSPMADKNISLNSISKLKQ